MVASFLLDIFTLRYIAHDVETDAIKDDVENVIQLIFTKHY